MPEAIIAKKARVILIGGFLGAGKTTAIVRLAKLLEQRGMKAGVLVNDQGRALVDHGLVQALGLAGAEVTGGCFCCRFDEFIGGLKNLADAGLDALLAEPVGSCADLAATVLMPLMRQYPDRFAPAPFSVLTDGTLLERLLPGGEGLPFSDDVAYLYGKQLEEASVLVLNKADLLGPERTARLAAFLCEKFPGRPVLPVSAATGEGFGAWLDCLHQPARDPNRLAEIDYNRYGSAEAALGWYNAWISFTRAREFDANDALRELLEGIVRASRDGGGTVAHLKALAKSEGGMAKAGATASGGVAFTLRAYDLAYRMDVVINARVEMEPEELKRAIDGQAEALAARMGFAVTKGHEECFKPSFPNPTWAR